MGKIWGPFHNRKPFFPRMATEYQFEVWIGPFGIPIPTVHPWVATRKNIWVPLYKAFSFFYTVSNNFVLGENLYPQADWWPFGHFDGVGRVPILPKLDPSAVKTMVRTITTSIPTTPAEVTSKFKDFLNNFWKNELLGIIKNQVVGTVVGSLALGNVPFAGDIFSGIVNDALSAMGVSQADLEQGKNGPGDLQTEVTAALTKPFNEILDSWEKLKSATLADAMAHEVAGLIIEGDGVRIGVTKGGVEVSPRPLMASGVIVSLNDVTLNVDSFVGTVSSRQGSIKGQDCRLLYYPLFSRASLYQPNRNPAIQKSSPLSSLSGVIQRALNWEYGVMCSAGSAIDVGVSGTTQTITAEGWDP